MSSVSTASPAALTGFAAAADARAQALEKQRETRLKEARQAVETLKQSRTSAWDTAKEMARQKLDQIKERIRLLKMTASMDPAGTARQIAALSRDLSAAVKAYAGAAKSGGETGGQVPASPEAPATGSEAAQTETTQTETTQTETSGEASAAVEVETSAQTGDEAAASGEHKTKDKPDTAAARAAELYRQIQSSPEVQARERDREARKAEAADAEDFLKQARDLAKALKDILQKVAEAAKARGEQGREDVEDAHKALEQVGQDINFAMGSMPAAPVALAA